MRIVCIVIKASYVTLIPLPLAYLLQKMLLCKHEVTKTGQTQQELETKASSHAGQCIPAGSS